MSITLKSLYYETKNKYKLKLIAGESGIDNVVSWFHFMEDESTINFIRGNELIVTTGLGSKNNDWLDNLIKGLIKNHVCGLIINIGQYIKTIPDHTISYCNENNFPLFIMPWEIHLVDIMQDYCDKIINAKQTASNISSAFFNAIYYPDNINLFKPPLKQEGYDLNGLFTIISLELESSIYSKTSEISLK
ncbi:PucR family transcriptional regulator ligand-binding domain-containing protein, partial [Clostridium neonatale]